MRKLDRVWDWLLPGLIALSPMGAIAYYDLVAEKGQRYESTRVVRRPTASDPERGAAVITIARL